MYILFVICIVLLVLAAILWAASEGEFTTFPATVWIIVTLVLIVMVGRLIPKDDRDPINADVHEEYWNGDIKNLEVYKRTKDSVYLRFKEGAYNLKDTCK